MATVFLDTNILIDFYGRQVERIHETNSHKLYISPLSCHILAYTNKLKVPSEHLEQALVDIGIVNLTDEILMRSMLGPTSDLEDNLQLHSCAAVGCNYFLTNDKQLLKLGYFGMTAIVNSLPIPA